MNYQVNTAACSLLQTSRSNGDLERTLGQIRMLTAIAAAVDIPVFLGSGMPSRKARRSVLSAPAAVASLLPANTTRPPAQRCSCCR